MDEQTRAAGRKKAPSNGTALIVLGAALFVMAFMILSTNPEGGAVGAVLFGVLGVGLIVAGIVIRPRT
jgi:hypothetical protein